MLAEFVKDLPRAHWHGLLCSSRPLNLISAPRPAALETNTLTAICDWFGTAEPEGHLFVHVESPTEVAVLSGLDKTDKKRSCFMKSKHQNQTYRFGDWLPVDKFIVAAQSQFIPTDDLAKIILYVGNLVDSREIETRDDGITQTAVVKSGLTTSKAVIIPNPVRLKPFRIFPEVDQSESMFTFRLRKSTSGEGYECALFEGDGGAWKNAAMLGIKQYLVEGLAGRDVTVLA
jgi:hypothetical protein